LPVVLNACYIFIYDISCTDSSVDTPYKDSTGIDLEDFIRKTLNKTPKDRSMLIKLEVDLIKFIREPK